MKSFGQMQISLTIRDHTPLGDTRLVFGLIGAECQIIFTFSTRKTGWNLMYMSEADIIYPTKG